MFVLVCWLLIWLSATEEEIGTRYHHVAKVSVCTFDPQGSPDPSVSTLSAGITGVLPFLVRIGSEYQILSYFR